MFDFFMQEVLGMHWLSELVWQVLVDMGQARLRLCGAVCIFLFMTL